MNKTIVVCVGKWIVSHAAWEKEKNNDESMVTMVTRGATFSQVVWLNDESMIPSQ
jgi:hypothetical protein